MNETLFPVGKVVGFQGLKGEIKVRPSTNNPELLLDIKKVRMHAVGTNETLATVKQLRLDKRLLFLTLEEFADRTAVEHLLDAELFVERSQLRELEGEQWWVNQLIGLKAYTTTGTYIGTVSNIVESGTQLLEIALDNDPRTILVPFVKDLVPLVDIQGRRVEITNLPGLLEPQ